MAGGRPSGSQEPEDVIAHLHCNGTVTYAQRGRPNPEPHPTLRSVSPHPNPNPPTLPRGSSPGLAGEGEFGVVYKANWNGEGRVLGRGGGQTVETAAGICDREGGWQLAGAGGPGSGWSDGGCTPFLRFRRQDSDAALLCFALLPPRTSPGALKRHPATASGIARPLNPAYLPGYPSPP